MRILLLVFSICFSISLIAQTKLPVQFFDNQLKLKNGIYTSHEELLNNAPSYPDCVLKVSAYRGDMFIPELTYYTIGHEDAVLRFNAPVFAFVAEGKLSVYYQKRMMSIYSKGTLCTFTLVKVKR